MKFPALTTQDGRRAFAFLAILGGCAVFTVFAAVGVYLVRNDTQLAFYLALAAHAQILVGMTALSAQVVKRSIQIGTGGVNISDNAIQSGDTVEITKP